MPLLSNSDFIILLSVGLQKFNVPGAGSPLESHLSYNKLIVFVLPKKKLILVAACF